MLKFGQDASHRSPKRNVGIAAGSAKQVADINVNFDFTKEPVPRNTTSFQYLLRNVDWTKSALGPMATWSRELRQMVRFMTADVNPIILYWGPSRSIIYNEAYIPLIGDKHPSILGQNAADMFPEFWPYFESVLTVMSEEGITQTGVGSMLLMQRHGFLEETYFDWKLMPIVGDDGLVQGAYGMPTESTVDVIGTRRTAAIQAISSKMATAANMDDVWLATIDGLKEDDRDVPFALIYATEQPNRTNGSNSNDDYEFELKGTIGVPSDANVLDKLQSTYNDCAGFAPVMLEAIESGNNVVVNASDPRVANLLMDMDWKGFGIPCHQFACVPVNTGSRIAAVMIFGFKSEETLVTDVVAPSIAKLRLSEELKHRAELAQRALQNFEQSEMRFARFAARSAIGLAVTDLSGQVLYANDAWYSFAGIDPDAVGITSWTDSVVEEDIEMLQHWWHNVTVLKQSGTFQFRSKQPFKNGDMMMPHKTGICACYADLDANGDVETVMGLIIDISELKWTEEQLVLKSQALEESEAKYRTFAEHAPLGVVRTDADGFVEFGNDAWHDFYGFKKGAVPDAQPWLPYIHPDDIPKARDYFDTLSSRPGPLSVELRLRRSYSITEGDRIIENDAWALATGVSENGLDGNIDHIDFWVTDISSQKMAAKVLTDKMEEAVRMRTQQERFIDMISHEIRNPLSACLSCSEQVIEAMEDSLKTMDAFPDASVIPAKQAFLQEDMRRHIDNALEAANTIMYCVQHQKQIVDDVLTLSKLDSDLLVVSPVPVEPLPLVKRSLKIFEPELKMSQISLTITEHESVKKLGVDWIMLDPNRFLQIVINLITNAIKFTRTSDVKKIDVKVSAKTTRPFGDEEGVEFVPRLYSIKRTPSIIDVNAKSPSDRVFLCISVSDSGKGLTAKEKTILFNRFAQASPKTHVEYGGSGLGLFISRQITEMLGGEIGVGDSPEKGCTFAFYVETTSIPPPGQNLNETSQPGSLQKMNSAPHLKQPGLLPPNSRPFKSKSVEKVSTTAARKVLVVEDNLVNQKVLCKQLRNRGFIVEAANHGKEALRALEKCQTRDSDPKLAKFDIILCDIEMPVMNGIECVQEVRRLEQTGCLLPHIPIIGVTANVRSKQVDAAIEAGMDGVTTKPYRMDELLAHIDRVCPASESAG